MAKVKKQRERRQNRQGGGLATEAAHSLIAPYIPSLLDGTVKQVDVVKATGVLPSSVSRAVMRARDGKILRGRGRPKMVSQSVLVEYAKVVSEQTRKGEPLNRSHARVLLGRAASQATGKAVSVSRKTFRRTLAQMGDNFMATTPKSTSLARLEANAVSVMEPFFLQLQSLRLQYPLLYAEPRRIVVTDESPLPTQGEKVNGKPEAVVVDKREPHGVPRAAAIRDGSARVTITSAVSADGYHWPNSYYVKGKFLQAKFTSPPLPVGITQEHLDSLHIAATDAGVATKEAFYAYVEYLVRTMRAQISSGPILILLDGPKCHGDIEELGNKYARDQVLFLAFPPNTTTKVCGERI